MPYIIQRFAPVFRWEPLTMEDIRTPKDVFQLIVDEGYRVSESWLMLFGAYTHIDTINSGGLCPASDCEFLVELFALSPINQAIYRPMNKPLSLMPSINWSTELKRD